MRKSFYLKDKKHVLRVRNHVPFPRRKGGLKTGWDHFACLDYYEEKDWMTFVSAFSSSWVTVAKTHHDIVSRMMNEFWYGNLSSNSCSNMKGCWLALGKSEFFKRISQGLNCISKNPQGRGYIKAICFLSQLIHVWLIHHAQKNKYGQENQLGRSSGDDTCNLLFLFHSV